MEARGPFTNSLEGACQHWNHIHSRQKLCFMLLDDTYNSWIFQLFTPFQCFNSSSPSNSLLLSSFLTANQMTLSSQLSPYRMIFSPLPCPAIPPISNFCVLSNDTHGLFPWPCEEFADLHVCSTRLLRGWLSCKGKSTKTSLPPRLPKTLRKSLQEKEKAVRHVTLAHIPQKNSLSIFRWFKNPGKWDWFKDGRVWWGWFFRCHSFFQSFRCLKASLKLRSHFLWRLVASYVGETQDGTSDWWLQDPT